MSVIFDVKTLVKPGGTATRRTSLSFDPLLWQLACFEFGSEDDLRIYLRDLAMKFPLKTSYARECLLCAIAKPSLVEMFKGAPEHQTDLDDF